MLSRRNFITAAAALCGCTTPARRETPAQAEQPQRKADESERQLFDAVNAVREKRGIGKLQWHEGAAVAAQSHSRAMAERGFFSHTDPERGDLAMRMRANGVTWNSVAENLFQQRGCPDAVQCAVDGWMQSSGHRQNLLNAIYTHTGIGISSNQDGTVYYTQIFLAP
jgi:uncharacterized protein YkwD